jgi:hypothetical protein
MKREKPAVSFQRDYYFWKKIKDNFIFIKKLPGNLSAFQIIIVLSTLQLAKY